MSVSRRFEQTLGVIAGLWGVLVLAFFLFGPVYKTIMSTAVHDTQTGSASGLQVGLPLATVILFVGLTITLIGIAVTALQDGRGIRGYRGWLRAATTIFAAFCLLTILSIGIFLVPGLVCAIIASILAGGGNSPRLSRA